MNIAKDLGSLISGLFAPQAAPSVQRPEQGGSSRSRTTTREQAGKRETTAATQGSDRLTLSSQSLSLANSLQTQAPAPPATSAVNSPAQLSELLALPYSPSETNPPSNNPPRSLPLPVNWSVLLTAAANYQIKPKLLTHLPVSIFTLSSLFIITPCPVIFLTN